MDPHAAPPLPPTKIAAYGLLGFPLAMAALPIYVHLPRFYGAELGVGLTTLGIVLALLRFADALIDPWLGVWSDRMRSRKPVIAAAMAALAAGFVLLFVPVPRGEAGLVAWLAASLALVYAAFSLASINHGAWGAELSTDPVERTRITATREALALVGVVTAAVGPTLLGTGGSGLASFAFGFAAVVAVATTLCLSRAPPASVPVRSPGARPGILAPLANPAFRVLLAAFVANGIAAAIPSQLVLFYVDDVLRAGHLQGMFLVLYFIAGAASLPVWVRASRRYGKVRAWLVSMGVAIAAFVWASALGPGDLTAFAVICVLSGAALGADLALPPSLLADVIARGRTAEGAGAYFGLWTLATKLNLGLAAGIALPLVALLGYSPGAATGEGTRALALVYALVPCILKLAAALLVHGCRRRLEGESDA